MSEKMSESNEQQPNGEPRPSQDAERKPYVPPQLTKHGHVIELTKGGGSIIDDGLGTLEGHV